MYTRLSLGFTTLITLHITSGSMLLLDKFLITDLGTSPWFNVNESLCNPVSASDQSEKYIDSTMSHICVSLLAKSNSLRTSVDFQLDGHGYNLVQSFNQKQRKTKKGTRPGEADVQQIERLIRGRDDSSIFLTSAASGSVWSQSVFFLIPSWIKKSFIKREAVPNRPQQRDGSRISWNGIIFLKCAMVNNREDLETATVHLLINSTDVSSPAMNMSNLIISDNITGIAIKDVSGTSTASVKGIQTFRKESLKAGEYILITYTASLNAEFAKYGSEFYLPAQLTFQNSSEGSSKLLVAPFTITANGNLKVVPNHGLHGAAFVIAFIVSLVLTGAICFAVYYIKKKRQSSLETKSKFKNEQKLEQSQINLQENANEDFIVYDKMIDILAFEEAENMLQALEDSEITNMSQADSYLEISRVHIYKDVTSIFVRNLTITLNLSPHETKMLSTVLNEQWTDLEKRINEEQQRRIVALTAECSLDTRKQMDIQYRKQKAASTEAEESSTEYKHLLDNLHDLEQAEMKRLLLFKQEEQFAKSHRQLSIAYRTELHNIFFDQLHNSVSRGKMKPDVQSVMIENYLKVQEESEDLMDFIQANKKYHMSRRISNRKNLIYSIQLCDSKCRCLLNSAATQISNLINRTERKIILLPLSLSEEDIQKIRQSFMCGFSQMDITLALPKIQGRKLLQTYLTEWRKEELLKLDHNVPESEKQLNVKTKNHLLEKPTEPFMKSIEDKILIYEAQMPDDMIKQARGELLIQRVHQLKDREYKLGEYIASLQFQLIANKSKELEIHMAVQHLQSLLLEEMCRSQIATESEYGKLLETRIQEIREIDQNMESWQQKEVENDKLNENYLSSIICEMNSTCEEDLDMPLSATLRSALNRRQNILRLYGERLQKEELEFAMVENQVEKAHMDEFIRLYKQDIRLTSYLTKRTLLPEGLLYQALNLLLPSSLETEIFSVLNSVSHKYSDGVTETDNIEEETDSWRKRKHQELWTVIEKRLKEGLVIQDNDKSSSARRKKRSILKKKRLRPVKRVSFSHTEDFSKLLQSVGRSKQFGNSEERELPENGEKLFIFRAPSETLKSSSVHKKKRNFLNFKKAMSAGV
ncbi:limbin isoform X2 [Bombina bombina]|uniref:limbin isoform X2 n=1 Tax=Bombina bombina TaxID=8345 RepID=UPI00235A893C|nr:limbin isoform X2 [Bombina bombina]